MKKTAQKKAAKPANDKIAKLATMTDEQLKSLKGGASEGKAGNAAAGFIIIVDMCW